MLGAHFDSWHASTGATDNGAGSGAMMEAMRILKASGREAAPHRAPRFVDGRGTGPARIARLRDAHFGPPQVRRGGAAAPATPPPPADAEQSRAREVRGLFQHRQRHRRAPRRVSPGQPGRRGIFREWMEPFHTIGMTTLTIDNTGGTDHQSFDAVGLPGFQFIQDAIEYDTMTHHTNLDLLRAAAAGGHAAERHDCRRVRLPGG